MVGVDEAAGPVEPPAAYHHVGAACDRPVDLVEDGLHRRLVHQGAQRGALVQRIAGNQAVHRRREAPGEEVGHGVVDDEALGPGAGLAGVHQPALDGQLDRVIEVGVVADDEGVAAAQLHGALLQRLAGLRRHRAAGPLAAGQRHPANAGSRR